MEFPTWRKRTQRGRALPPQALGEMFNVLFYLTFTRTPWNLTFTEPLFKIRTLQRVGHFTRIVKSLKSEPGFKPGSLMYASISIFLFPNPSSHASPSLHYPGLTSFLPSPLNKDWVLIFCQTKHNLCTTQFPFSLIQSFWNSYKII